MFYKGSRRMDFSFREKKQKPAEKKRKKNNEKEARLRRFSEYDEPTVPDPTLGETSSHKNTYVINKYTIRINSFVTIQSVVVIWNDTDWIWLYPAPSIQSRGKREESGETPTSHYAVARRRVRGTHGTCL